MRKPRKIRKKIVVLKKLTPGCTLAALKRLHSSLCIGASLHSALVQEIDWLNLVVGVFYQNLTLTSLLVNGLEITTTNLWKSYIEILTKISFLCHTEIFLGIPCLAEMVSYLQRGQPQLTHMTGVAKVRGPRHPRQTGAPSGAATKAVSSTTTSPTLRALVAKSTLPTMST